MASSGNAAEVGTGNGLDATSKRGQTDPMASGSDTARALHAEHPVIDLHADTLMWSRWVGYDLHKAHEPPLPFAALGGHVDLPRMREGGMGAQFFSLVSLPLADRPRGMARAVHEQIDALAQQMARRPDALRLVRKAAEIERCKAEGVMGALLGIEGAHALEGSLDNVAVFARRGVRYIGVLHFSANEAGYPAYGRGRRDTDGLTRWGFELVERCEAENVLVDLSHINRQGFLDACQIAKKPPIVSHTGVLGAFEHWRNIDDAQLRAVADKGGVVGVIFCPKFVGGDGLEPVVKHLKHIVDIVGEDAPALGSDWDGFIVPTKALKDPRGLPLLTDALLEAGFSEKAVGKILRGNVMRVLDEA
jgi:membrane dipeptidase